MTLFFSVAQYVRDEGNPADSQQISLTIRQTAVPFTINFIPTTVDDSLDKYNLRNFLPDTVSNLLDDQKATPGKGIRL